MQAGVTKQAISLPNKANIALLCGLADIWAYQAKPCLCTDFAAMKAVLNTSITSGSSCRDTRVCTKSQHTPPQAS